ncbi:MAG: hypothetical protein LGR52_02840 [Candidatus Thiosymbion ectosymbiont of Robbea hypermnestra]|nr:hypothetical protein [Candidatus Thiosymbion ectosymbiont of Robbea hypermnestra]
MNRIVKLGLGMGFLASMLASSNALSQESSRTINITSPSCGGTFSCEAVRGNECFFTVQGTANGLTDGDYVSLLLKIVGGREWWQGGNSVGYNEDFSDSWIISMVSVDPTGISRNFVGRAIVTRGPQRSGRKYSRFPSDVAISTSAFCQWTLQTDSVTPRRP